ncbi:hypothetical protein ACFP51_21265 [Streptomyces pratens]|uniref:hypothetical protein n=1 Tax=Streptomyces pratens TaxID=887456 RepID=UPI003623E0B8
MYRLAVHPGHRRQGIAPALPAAAGERFAGLGGRRADAMLLRRNETAHRAWDAAGGTLAMPGQAAAGPHPGRQALSLRAEGGLRTTSPETFAGPLLWGGNPVLHERLCASAHGRAPQ